MTLRFDQCQSAKSGPRIDLLVPQEPRSGAASTPAVLSRMKMNVRVAPERPLGTTGVLHILSVRSQGWQLCPREAACGRSQRLRHLLGSFCYGRRIAVPLDAIQHVRESGLLHRALIMHTEFLH